MKQLFLLACLFLSLQTWAQRTLQGRIRDAADNQPVIGAAIQIKGSTKGTVTNENGLFTIQASPTQVLHISMIGYEPIEITVGTQTNFDLLLKPSETALESVVVMGYSEKTRKELSASVVSVSEKQLQNVAAPDLPSMLQGKVAGLLVNNSSGAPGAPAKIRVRGINSINVDRPPLVVVDGIIGGTYVPNDVESVSVLKDAAAIGLYGSAGSGGVIIVNTKQAARDRTDYSFSARTGIKQATTGNFSLMNSQTLYATQQKMWGNDLVNFLRNRPEDLKRVDYNWLGVAFRNAVLQNYNFAMRGNPSGKAAYTFSADYFDEQGTLLNTDFKRLNLHTNLRLTPNPKLTLTNDINLQFNTNNTFFYDWLYDAFLYLPWDNPYGPDGNPQYVDPSTPTTWYSRDRSFPGMHLPLGVSKQVISPDDPRHIYYIPLGELQINPLCKQNP